MRGSEKKRKLFEDLEKAENQMRYHRMLKEAQATFPSGASKLLRSYDELCGSAGHPAPGCPAGTEPATRPVWPDGYALVPDPDPFRGRKPILVDDESFPEDSMCPVCWEVPFDAVRFPYCSHGLCGACMKEIAGTARSVLCPLCRKRQTLTFWRKKNGGGFPTDVELRAKVDELWVFCPRASEGAAVEKEGPKCDVAFPLGKLRDHLRVCPHSTVRCNAEEGEAWGEKCNHVGLLKDLADHRGKDCAFIRRKCTRCGRGVTTRNMKDHLEHYCDARSPCPQCGRSVLERSTERHLRDECDFKLRCPECEMDVEKRFMVHHRSLECSERSTVCGNRGCTWSGKIYGEDDHRKTCEFADVECPLSECAWRGSPLDLNGHLAHPSSRSQHGELLLCRWERRGLLDHSVANHDGQKMRMDHGLCSDEASDEPGGFFCTYTRSPYRQAYPQGFSELEPFARAVRTLSTGTALPRNRPEVPTVLSVRWGDGIEVAHPAATYALRVWRSGDWVSLELATAGRSPGARVRQLDDDLPDFSVKLVAGGFPMNHQQGVQRYYVSGGTKVDSVGWKRFVPWDEWEEMRASPASESPMEGLWREGDSLVFDFYR